MPYPASLQRAFVTGATGFLGYRVVAALLEADLRVTVLTRAEQADKLVAFQSQVDIVYGDIWNRSSLTGMGRGQEAVIHLVGSAKADPTRGLTHQQINLVAARNVIGMAISAGIPHFILLSIAGLSGFVQSDYLRSKREAEDYLRNSGLGWTIIRAPAMSVPSLRRPVLYSMVMAGIVPPTRWAIGRYMPIAVDIAARGIVGALQETTAYQGRILYANDLRRLARKNAPAAPLRFRPAEVRRPKDTPDLDETPFGWLPPHPPHRRR
ncbi:MAG: SDR family oxidoreductase [Anaerolineales bacterium]